MSIVGELSDSYLKSEIRHSYLIVIRKNVTPSRRRDELLEIVAKAGIVDDAEWLE